MHRRWLLTLIGLLVGGLLLPVKPVLADGEPPENGVVIWNEDYTLEEDERLEGNLIVFNGDVTLEPGSTAAGSVIIWNGSAEIEGTIEGDLVVSGGDIKLGEDARVEGDVVCSWNCDIEQKVGARVGGGIIEGVPLPNLPPERMRDIPPLPQIPSLPQMWAAGPGRMLDWALRAARSLAAILVVSIVAGLVALLWPQQTERVGHTVVEAPWPSLGVGLLTVFAGTALIVALAITICLSPVAILAALALSAAGLFGWIGAGGVVGKRLLRALNVREITPLWAAGLGALLITLVSTGLSSVFCLAPVGWLLIIVLGCIGLGAVVLTRFGTMAYVPSTGTVPTPPPEPPLAEAPKPPEPPAPPEPPEPAAGAAQEVPEVKEEGPEEVTDDESGHA